MTMNMYGYNVDKIMNETLGTRRRGRRGRLYSVFAEVNNHPRILLADFDVQKTAISFASHVRRGNHPNIIDIIGCVSFRVIVERRSGEVLYNKSSIAERYIRSRFDLGLI